ncbi:MAG: biopolymer transporter ExbD [Steroidobacteraceae bacterium]|nr:biopolymer transporter ExbD [Steroidobacteraceae bacterium]
MNLRPRRAEEPEINLISLIDVVLMIVIFFMVSSTFIEETAPLARGETQPIVVTVTQGGGYRVNERELVNASAETLRAALLRLASAERAEPVTVRADGRATHQSVVTAMDVIGRLGFREINIATVTTPAAPGGGAGRPPAAPAPAAAAPVAVAPGPR